MRVKIITSIIVILCAVFVITVTYAQMNQFVKIERYFNQGTTGIGAYVVLQHDTSKSVWVTLDTTASLGVNTSWVTYQIVDTAGKGTGTYNTGVLYDTLSNHAGEFFELWAMNITAGSNDTVCIFGDVLPNNNIYNPYPFGGFTINGVDTICFVSGIHQTRSKKFWVEVDSIKIKTAGAGSDSVKFYIRQPLAAKLADSLEVNTLGISIGPNRYYNETNPAADTVTAKSFGYAVTSGAAKAYGFTDGGTYYITKGQQLVSNGTGRLMAPKALSATADTAVVREWVIRNLPSRIVGTARTEVDSVSVLTEDKAIMWVDVGK
jgi:hypothetical protein